MPSSSSLPGPIVACRPTVTRRNYGAAITVLNAGRFAPSGVGSNVPKCPKVLGQYRNVPRKHVAGVCGAIEALFACRLGASRPRIHPSRRPKQI